MEKTVENENRSIPLTTYISGEEARTVKKWITLTNSKSISAFLRKTLYMSGCCIVRIRLDNPILSKISDELHLFNIYLIQLIEVLLNCNEVDMDDIDAIKQKMDDLNILIEKIHKIAMIERNFQREKAERYLKDWVDNLLGISKKE